MRTVRILHYILLLVVFFLIPLRHGYAQAPAGKEFMVTLPPWLSVSEMNFDIGRFTIDILCPRQTHVSVRWPDGSYLANADVQANSRLVVMRPQFHLYQIAQSPYDIDVEKINQRALIVTADQPVTVQATFDTNYRAETYMVYPVESWGTEYTLVNYAGYVSDRTGMLIMASQDNTQISITPTVETMGLLHSGGGSYSITLNKYQVYPLMSNLRYAGPDGDLTGTKIRSNKPVGVLSYSLGSDVPSYGHPPLGPDPDHPAPVYENTYSKKPIAEFQEPENAAGTLFYAMPFLHLPPSKIDTADGNLLWKGRPRRDSSHIRFYVLDGPTTFDTNGVRLKNEVGGDSIFNKGARFNFTFAWPTKIEASKPVLAMQLMTSGIDVGLVDSMVYKDTTIVIGNGPKRFGVWWVRVPWGNPSMTCLPPVSRYKPDLQVAIPSPAERPALLFNPFFTPPWRQYLQIIAPVAAASRVKLNGAAVKFDQNFSDGKYVGAYVKVYPGTRQTIESPEPILTISYGITTEDSYASLAGESRLSNVHVLPDTLRFFSCTAEKDTFVTVANVGSGGFRIDSFRVTGVAASLLQPAFAPPYVYSGSVNEKLVFRFVTPTPGVYQGAIRLYTDANNQAVFDIPFVITRDSAQLGLPATTVDFGVLKAAQTQRDTVVVVRNNGIRPLVITSVSFIGTGYQLIGATLPDTLAPGESDSLHLRFTPSGDGLREADLRIDGTPCMSGLTVHLRAFKGSGATVLVQRSLQYGSYLCDYPLVIDSVLLLRSIGDEPIVIASGTIEGTDKSEFTLLDSMTNVTVLPGDTARFRVRYTPSGSGARRATLKLVTNAKNGLQIDIELIAHKDTVTLDAVSDSIDVGRLYGCDSLAETSVRVKNNGTIADTITSADVGGAAGYVITSSVPVVVQPGTEQEVRVRFAPLSDGSYSGTLTVHGTPCDVRTSVKLTGERRTPHLSVSGLGGGGTIEFDTVTGCDGRVTRKLVVYNSGSVADTIHGLDDGGTGTFSMRTDDLPKVLQPGERDTVEVGFVTTVTGVYTSMLNVTWGPCNQTSSIGARVYGVLPSVLLSGGRIEFDSVHVGTSGHGRLVIRNTGTAPRRVSGITITGTSAVTVVTPSKIPAEIAVGDSLMIDVAYTPLEREELAATAHIVVDAPCGLDTTVSIHGFGVGDETIESSLTVVAPSVEGMQNQVIDLPVSVENWTNVDAIGATKLVVGVSWRYSVFAPQGVSTSLPGMTAKLVGDHIEGSRRRVQIELSGGTFPTTGELARIQGLMLVGDTNWTQVGIDTVEVTVPVNRAVMAMHRDGDLRVIGICVTGGARYVILGGVRLKSVIPNPMREGAEIELEADARAPVVVRVYDGYGRTVRTLLDGEIEAGDMSVRFDAGELPSGVYTCEVESRGQRQRAVIVLVQ